MSTYNTGFGNEFSTEAVAGALPKGQNSPQKPPLGLYAEQLSGTAFTAPRHLNRRSWLYRIRPSVVHEPFAPRDSGTIRSAPFDEVPAPPSQLRWDAFAIPPDPCDWLDGLMTIAGNDGIAVHVYVANRSMADRFFYDADGELLIVPQQGFLSIRTELGIVDAGPGEIAVIPRGVKFRVELIDDPVRGYVCENYGAPLRLPELGPIGSNGLASPRHFLTPAAAYEDREGDFEMVAKFGGRLWTAKIDHSPLDVVAWHGNYAPYKYDLRRFNAINTVSFDHPDPSIFTVLSAEDVDFVLFPPRWLVGEHTFRPPYFHRNVMNEYMGLIFGVYDAKASGFEPGGGSLHNCMSGHGPDAETWAAASEAKLEPQYLADTLAFMFETRRILHPTKLAMEAPQLQRDYWKCWQGLKKQFRA